MSECVGEDADTHLYSSQTVLAFMGHTHMANTQMCLFDHGVGGDVKGNGDEGDDEDVRVGDVVQDLG